MLLDLHEPEKGSDIAILVHIFPFFVIVITI
jgi:hypothetical protein